MRRDWPVYLALLLLLALLAGWIGIARFPESEPAVAAERWPLVGPWIGELRRIYLPPEPPGSPADGENGEVEGRAGGAPGPAEASSTELPPPSLTPRRDALWLAPGEPLRARPDSGSEVLTEAGDFVEVPVLERAGRWRRVSLGGRNGWVLPPLRAPGEPPLGRAPLPPLPLPAREPNPARLEAARRLLSPGAVSSRLGPYRLHSDASPDLLATLGRIAAAVEPAYRERYRRTPLGEPAEAVVIFAREADYRAYQGGEERLGRLPASGHAGGGVVALWSGGRRRAEVGSTLVHELVHLLNRRALGPALPPWLDEGIAEDLAASAIDARGALDPGRFGGAVEREVATVTYHGARAALAHLATAEARGELPRPSALVRLDWEGFVLPEQRDLHYPLAGFFIRYLVSGEGGELAPGFHAFLAAVAAGGPVDGEALVRHLGRSWDAVERGFERWLRDAAAAEAGYVS